MLPAINDHLNVLMIYPPIRFAVNNLNVSMVGLLSVNHVRWLDIVLYLAAPQ